MTEYYRELHVMLGVSICLRLCVEEAKRLDWNTKYPTIEGKPKMVLEEPNKGPGKPSPVVILVDFHNWKIDGAKVSMWAPVDTKLGPTRHELVGRKVEHFAGHLEWWDSYLSDEARPADAHRHEADTAPGTTLKGAAGAAAKAVAGGVFKKAKEAVNKKRFEVGPNETVFLQTPAGRLRHNELKDRINKYARENLTTPLVIGTGAATTMLGRRYKVDGRMTVTDRRLLFEPDFLMVKEPSVEIFLDEIAEVLDDRTYVWWNRQIGIVTTRGDGYIFVVVNKYEVMDLLNERVREIREAPGSLGDEPPPVNADFEEGKKGVGEPFDLGTGSTAGMGEKLKGLAWNRMRKRKAEPSGDLSSELKRLADLREKGVLNEEEFRRAKARLIDG